MIHIQSRCNVLLSAAIAALAIAPCRAQVVARENGRTHQIGNEEFGGRATSRAKAFRTGSATSSLFGGVELELSNRAHNPAGDLEIGNVRIIGGQVKGGSSSAAVDYGLTTVDTGGYRRMSRSFGPLNDFDETYYFDTGWRGDQWGGTLIGMGTDARLYGAARASVHLATVPSFGVYGNASASSTAAGQTQSIARLLGIGADYLSGPETYGNLQSTITAHIAPSVVSATAVHSCEPWHVTITRWTRVWFFSNSPCVLLDLLGPRVRETWFSF